MRTTANALLRIISFMTGKGTSMVLALFFVVFVTGVAGTVLYARDAHALTNSTINFQARVLQVGGAVVPDGSLSVQFKIYNAASAGTNEWTETQSLSAKNGYITASLGSVTPFASTIDWSQEHWITMNINGDGEMGPTRMKITAVPYSFRSGQADSLTNGSGTISASQLAQLAPGTIQGVSSVNTALRINQTGAGNLLQLQGNSSDVFTVSKAGDVVAAGGLTVGNSTSTTAGTIRWTGTAFEGYNGTSWSSLGGGLVLSSGSTATFTSGLQNVGANLTGTPVETLVFTSATAVSNTAGVTGFTAPSAGSFRTCLIKNNANITAGTLNLRWRVNGVSVGAGACTMNATTNRQSAGSLDAGVVTFNAGDTIGIAFDTVGLAPITDDFTVYWSVEYSSSSSSLTMQKVYDSSPAPVTVITADNKDVRYTLSNTTTDSNFLVNIATGSTSKFAVQNNGTDIFNVNTSGGVGISGNLSVSGTTTLSGNLLANGSATGTTATTAAPTRTNVTTVTLTGAAFANNDVIFINNAGQDYYTRVVSGGGTTTLTVSPSVSYDAGATVTKYTVQNIGASATDYTTQANRFFQGYFLGGVVVGAGSTTISDGNISSTTTLTLQQNGNGLAIGGALTVAGTITGSGAGITNIDGSQITGGSIADGSLSGNVTLLGNTFNGLNQLVKLDGSGALPSLSGAALTSLNGSNINSGTVADTRLSGNVTKAGNTFNGINGLVQLDGSGKLPVLDGSNLTNITGSSLTGLNASNISSGTLADARLSSSVTLMGSVFNGASQLVQLNASSELPALSGVNLTSLNASNLSSGTVNDLRLSSNITKAGNTFNGVSGLVQLDGSGNLPALNGSALTTLNGSNITSGTVADARLSANVTLMGNTFNAANKLLQLDAGGKIDDTLLSTNVTIVGNTFNGNNQLVKLGGTGALPALNGAALTSLNGSNIATGTVADARLSSNVTLMGSAFNGISQLVQLDGSGNLPALNGSALTAINASNVSSGTLNDLRLSSNVTKVGNTFNGISQLVLLDGGGSLPALNGSALTSLNGTNISSGTVADARLTANITKAGNTFNGVSGLVQLDGSGNLPALNGSALTTLNASNISSGTVNDLRLSSNVTLMTNTFNGNNQLVKLDGTGALPALNGGALTNLNGTALSAGTVADVRLSSNVSLLGSVQTYTAQKTFAANITLGTDSASPTAGLLTLNDTTASNGFTSVLGTTALTASRSISLPDEAGILCIRGSTACGFALIGSATAQTDNSNNPSLFINKGAAATGNLLTLQKNGTTVLSVLNTGALALQTTATNAVNVKNAGGTDFFNVDTSGGLVQIGSATADANATLLVLDTKNTAGDPTGVNGGSYYNSASGKNRCYENNNWHDCTTAVNENKTADQTITNSAVFTNDSNLVYAVAANASYKIDATINYSTTSAAADFKYTFTIPAGATVFLATDADIAATTRTICNITASGQTCTLANTANFRGIIHVTGIVTTAATAGNIQFQFAQNTATGGQSVTVYKGSLLSITRTDQ